MALEKYESWNSAVPPALPSGWNGSANFSTVSGSPYGGNSLFLAGSATGSNNYLTWGTSAPAECYCYANVYIGAVGALQDQWGITARGSASTLNDVGTSQYVAWFVDNSNTVKISKIIAGAETVLATLAMVDTFASATWYRLGFWVVSTSLGVYIYRLSDGYALNTSGSFTAVDTNCLTVTDSTLTGSGYYGVVAKQSAINRLMYSDEFYLTSNQSFVFPPRNYQRNPDRNHRPRYWV